VNTWWPGVGRASSEATVAAAAKLSVDKFRQEAAVPPFPAKEAVHLMLATRRRPLFVGGCYRKLLR